MEQVAFACDHDVVVVSISNTLQDNRRYVIIEYKQTECYS